MVEKITIKSLWKVVWRHHRERMIEIHDWNLKFLFFYKFKLLQKAKNKLNTCVVRDFFKNIVIFLTKKEYKNVLNFSYLIMSIKKLRREKYFSNEKWDPKWRKMKNEKMYRMVKNANEKDWKQIEIDERVWLLECKQ